MAKRLLKNRRYHVDLKRRTQYMGRTIRTIAHLSMAWLAALSILTAAYAQTAEQLRRLEQLSPAQRAADIRPGDTIVVPLDADRMNRLTLWANVSTIIYNIGVAAAAVDSFGN